MIEPSKRDTTADSPDWVRLDEFSIGIGGGDRVRLTVYRNTTDPMLHRLTSDEQTKAGPRLIAVFTEPPGDHEEWHPGWRTDPMRSAVEGLARRIARM
ncbi:hypothetical protein [Glycomyces sp. YM15]|uniref:hypothetical protein n=1 Tax=Glycomyces sp. YM15 TaxID=2800446 RepID=UPI0019652833|nr:hypothetical protein [Glycomyces sp. YM15]